MALDQKEEEYGVIRVCCVCHHVINEKETIARIEVCAREYLGVKFSHGLCPRCFKLEMAKMKTYNIESQHHLIQQ